MPIAPPSSSSYIPQFSFRAKNALRAMKSKEDRVETILFLLQTTQEADSVIKYADIRAAQLMVGLRIHLLGEWMD